MVGLASRLKSAAVSEPENQSVVKGKLICQELEKAPRDTGQRNEFLRQQRVIAAPKAGCIARQRKLLYGQMLMLVSTANAENVISEVCGLYD